MSLPIVLGILAAVAAPAAAATPPDSTVAAASAPAASSAVIRYDAGFFTEMRPNTAFEMIQRLPGFTFDPGPQVRGFAGAAGNVLIDGDRPTSKQDDLESILKRVPASQVDHIEVIRGGAPGIDMQGRTVLANVVRKGGSGVSGVVALADQVYYDGRQAPAARFELTKKWDGKTLELSLLPALFVDDGAGDGPRVRVDPNGNVLVKSNVDTAAGGSQVNATAAFETPLSGGKFRVNTLVQYQGYHENDEDHLVTPTGVELLHDHQNRWQGELGLHYEKTLSAKTSLEVLGLQQVKDQTYTSHFVAAPDDFAFRESDTLGESILRSTLRYKPTERFQVEFAAEGAYNIQKSESRYAQNAAPVILPAADVTVSEKRAEGSMIGTWRPSKRFTLEAGLKAEVSNIGSTGDVALTKTLFFPKPRILATFSPNEDNQLRVRLEREVGQLDFSDFVASSALSTGSVHAGNPDLEPQKDWVAEVAYERHLMGAVFVLTARHQWISDVVDRIPIYSPSGVYDAPGNIGSAKENDLELNLTLPLDHLGLTSGQLKAQGTYRDSKVRDPTTGEERHISGQHRFDYEIHFTHDLPAIKSSWGIDVFNRWTETYYRFNEIDVYKLKTWVDVFIEYKPKPYWSFRLEGDNLGSRGFQRVLYVYPGPRNTSPLDYIDDRRLDFGPAVYMRIRRTFG